MISFLLDLFSMRHNEEADNLVKRKRQAHRFSEKPKLAVLLNTYDRHL